jgi:two-component system, cell cycle response regulator DivK
VNGIGDGRLVLIVEDNQRTLKLARDVLQFHGFRTVEAEDGEAGVALAQERVPDVILMDIGLPGMDGMSAARQLKDVAATAGIPVVALTASVMQADRSRFEEVGFAGIIAKPIDVLTFPAQVLGYCRREPSA